MLTFTQQNKYNFPWNQIWINNIFTWSTTSPLFDLVVLDAPCSAIGTIRRNPEIFFRKKHLNFKKTLLLQESLLEKYGLIRSGEGLDFFA